MKGASVFLMITLIPFAFSCKRNLTSEKSPLDWSKNFGGSGFDYALDSTLR